LAEFKQGDHYALTGDIFLSDHIPTTFERRRIAKCFSLIGKRPFVLDLFDTHSNPLQLDWRGYGALDLLAIFNWKMKRAGILQFSDFTGARTRIRGFWSGTTFRYSLKGHTRQLEIGEIRSRCALLVSGHTAKPSTIYWEQYSFTGNGSSCLEQMGDRLAFCWSVWHSQGSIDLACRSPYTAK